MSRELEESLTGRVIAASGEVVRKLHNVKDAQVGRDAFAKVRLTMTLEVLVHALSQTGIVGRATLKMLRRKTQFVKPERHKQNAIVLFNYLKRIAPQQLMLKTQFF